MIELKDVSFCYDTNGGTGGVSHLDLTIRNGETVLLVGSSGCGKTTVTRLINGLIPHFYEGVLTGEVLIDNTLTVSQTDISDVARKVGTVFQNPRSQFFNVDTDSEIAFTCENMELPEDEIKQRIAKTVQEFHIEDLMNRNIFQLSGGEKQKIACACVRAFDPGIYVFDEPSSNLDIVSTKHLREILDRIKEVGKTIIITEHRLSYLRGLADRVLYMKEGRIEREFSGREFDALTNKELEELGLRSTVRFAYSNTHTADQDEKLVLHDFELKYKNGCHALHIDHAEIPLGSVCAILGHNGAGKTTLCRSLCGLERGCRGRLLLCGKQLNKRNRRRSFYLVMQDVNHQLFTESVLEETLLSMEQPKEELALEILRALDLEAKKSSHPMALSGGQKQRVAIASAIASDRSIVVFDEPTSGLDLMHMDEIATLIRRMKDMGKTVLIVTHDPELVSRCCDHFLFMQGGKIIWAGGRTSDIAKKLNEFFCGL